MPRNAAHIASIAVLVLLSCGSIQAQPRGSSRPNTGMEFRIGTFMPKGGGEFWNDTEDVFTLHVSDLNDLALGFSYTSGLNNYLEVGFNVEFYSSTSRSAYRDIVDSENRRILHDTRLDTFPLTADLRVLPFGRYRERPGGRQVLHPAFYVGGGVGVNFWEYEEKGDFVDLSDPDLDPLPPPFYGRFKDNGTTLETHVLAGVELPINPRFNLVFEGRYSWCDENLGDDFEGLGNIELGGTYLYVGGSFRY